VIKSFWEWLLEVDTPLKRFLGVGLALAFFAAIVVVWFAAASVVMAYAHYIALGVLFLAAGLKLRSDMKKERGSKVRQRS
jgi:predicted Na+-dependent transporter